VLSIALAAVFGPARAQVLTPRPQELRFQALLNEPIATPDGKSVVAGTSALMVRDRETGQCYVIVTLGSAISMSSAGCAK
jgi:hypothetical protein